MNRLKTVISVLSAALIMAGCLAGCAKPPKDEATTGTEVYEVIKKNNELSKSTDENTPDSFISKSSDVVFTISSYNTFDGNYGTIKNITVDNESFTANANCYCDLEMIYVGNDNDKMRIAYKAYDASGNIVRDSMIQADVKDVKSGETVTGVRFDIPYNTASVVFSDFTGE